MGLADELELPDKDPVLTQAHQLNDAAMAILKQDRYGTAAPLAMLHRVLALVPDLPEALSNLGLVLWRMGDLGAAGAAFSRAVHLKPDNHTFRGNLGVFLGALGLTEDARDQLQVAHRLDPDNFGPVWDMCLLDLRAGNWKKGLAAYDIRREHRGASLYPPMPAPLWRGEDLSGKTLYIQGEQGVGDRFLFSRYFTWIKQTWPTCTLKVCLFDSLVNIFWEFRDTITFMPQGVPWPTDVDYAAFLCSLPEMHGSMPNYVPDDPGLLRQRIARSREKTHCNLPKPTLPSLKVGLVWTGNPTQTRNHDRSIPLEMLLPLAEDPRIMLYSFQCSPGQSDMERLGAGDLICDLGPGLEKEGWVGTGLALLEMDLLITVCTSVPHLAGALGVPTWVMLCADPYWVWSRSGDTTPWYPSLKLFRQHRLGDWTPVINEVRTELSKLADSTFPSNT